MRGGRRPAEWAVFYSKPPSPICNRDLHNSRRPFTIVSRVLHFVESRPGGARRPAAPGDPAGAHGVLQVPDRWLPAPGRHRGGSTDTDRKSTRLNSSHSQISYAVFCLKKKKKNKKQQTGRRYIECTLHHQNRQTH